jgi:histidine phosphotransferase ChpT
VLIATSAIARGGVVTVDLIGQGETLAIRVEAKGPNARLAHGVAELLAGRPQSGEVDAHTIQPFFAGLVARDCGLEVAIRAEAETVTLETRPAAVVAA